MIHQTVHGASGFAADATFDSLRESDCTSCKVTEDLSNYWFPKLYFHDRAADTFEEVSNGGLLIYYQNRGNEDVKNGGPGIKAFPPGLKMISGNPMRRTNKYAFLSIPAGLKLIKLIGTRKEITLRRHWTRERSSSLAFVILLERVMTPKDSPPRTVKPV